MEKRGSGSVKNVGREEMAKAELHESLHAENYPCNGWNSLKSIISICHDAFKRAFWSINISQEEYSVQLNPQSPSSRANQRLPLVRPSLRILPSFFNSASNSCTCLRERAGSTWRRSCRGLPSWEYSRICFISNSLFVARSSPRFRV